MNQSPWERTAKVEYVDFSKYERVIALSDIHGDMEGFQNVLKSLDFSEKDALVIVGDILEKGRDSLALLRLVMDYIGCGNVYMTAGNNDVLFLQWFEGVFSDKDTLWYLNSRKNSVMIDMAHELGLPFKTMEELLALKAAIPGKFSKEIQFLKALPDIIDCELATFVHAGIEPKPLTDQNHYYCIVAEEFGHQTHRFEKPVVVGHWPTSNYCEDIIDTNIYYNKQTNVYSIDGCNSMKSWQQINYLIFSDGKLISGYYAKQPKIIALEAQPLIEQPRTLLFPRTRIEIKERYERQSLCYNPYLDEDLWIDNDRIYMYKGQMYCYDFTTYQLEVDAGEVLYLCDKTDRGILVKRDGIVGNYYGKYEMK